MATYRATLLAAAGVERFNYKTWAWNSVGAAQVIGADAKTYLEASRDGWFSYAVEDADATIETPSYSDTTRLSPAEREEVRKWIESDPGVAAPLQIPRVDDAAARLALVPDDGDKVYQLDTDAVWLYRDGSWEKTQDAASIVYAADVAGDWATEPTDVNTAVDALAALGNAASRTLWVSANRGSAGGTGSILRPFLTIQAAVDAADDLDPTPDHDAPCAVLIEPGIYAESVVVKRSGVALVGLGDAGQGVVAIRPEGGAVALTITNATAASLAAFYAAGGRADPTTNWAELVADTYHPWDVQVRGIDFGVVAEGGYDVMALGVGDGNSVAGNEFNFFRCAIRGKVYARGVNYLSLQEGCWVTGAVEHLNCAGVWVNRSQIGSLASDYDAGLDEPSDDGNYGLSGCSAFIDGNWTMEGSVKAGVAGLHSLTLNGNLDVDDTASPTIRGGRIKGNATFEDGCTGTLYGVQIDGNLTLAAGAGAVNASGGSIIGAITDDDSRLSWAVPLPSLLAGAFKLPSVADNAARDALGAVDDGTIVYVADSDTVQVRAAGAWATLATV